MKWRQTVLLVSGACLFHNFTKLHHVPIPGISVSGWVVAPGAEPGLGIFYIQAERHRTDSFVGRGVDSLVAGDACQRGCIME
jgi:hypothetical protein